VWWWCLSCCCCHFLLPLPFRRAHREDFELLAGLAPLHVFLLQGHRRRVVPSESAEQPNRALLLLLLSLLLLLLLDRVRPK
jgi:hypothetical protein